MSNYTILFILMMIHIIISYIKINHLKRRIDALEELVIDHDGDIFELKLYRYDKRNTK